MKHEPFAHSASERDGGSGQSAGCSGVTAGKGYLDNKRLSQVLIGSGAQLLILSRLDNWISPLINRFRERWGHTLSSRFLSRTVTTPSLGPPLVLSAVLIRLERSGKFNGQAILTSDTNITSQRSHILPDS